MNHTDLTARAGTKVGYYSPHPGDEYAVLTFEDPTEGTYNLVLTLRQAGQLMAQLVDFISNPDTYRLEALYNWRDAE